MPPRPSASARLAPAAVDSRSPAAPAPSSLPPSPAGAAAEAGAAAAALAFSFCFCCLARRCRLHAARATAVVARAAPRRDKRRNGRAAAKLGSWTSSSRGRQAAAAEGAECVTSETARLAAAEPSAPSDNVLVLDLYGGELRTPPWHAARPGYYELD